MVVDGLPVRTACRVLGVSESGFYDWRTRPPSARAVRHAWLGGLIRQIRTDTRGAYGWRRMHAELTLGHGIRVGHSQVELLMRRAGITGRTGRPKWRQTANLATATDLVDRRLTRDDRDRLWVTDIERHEALCNRAVVKGHRLRSVAAGRDRVPLCGVDRALVWSGAGCCGQ